MTSTGAEPRIGPDAGAVPGGVAINGAVPCGSVPGCLTSGPGGEGFVPVTWDPIDSDRGRTGPVSVGAGAFGSGSEEAGGDRPGPSGEGLVPVAGDLGWLGPGAVGVGAFGPGGEGLVAGVVRLAAVTVEALGREPPSIPELRDDAPDVSVPNGDQGLSPAGGAVTRGPGPTEGPTPAVDVPATAGPAFVPEFPPGDAPVDTDPPPA